MARSPKRSTTPPPAKHARARRERARPEPAPDLPPGHPAFLIVLLAAIACAVISVTIQIYDTDFWHHLLVGKVMWQQHTIPTKQIWAWSTYGAPDVNASPLFRALVWPFWSAGGLTGLFVWRWLTTLAVFGFAYAAARRMGARGLSVFVVFVVCILNYRQRSQIRPETLASVLLAAQIWILETRRTGGPDRTPWLILIAWLWANSHISYWVGFLVLGLHVIDSALPGAVRPLAREPRVGGMPKLVAVTLAAAAVSFINPFGWRALWLPFDFVLHLRGDPIYRTIGELQPVLWSNNARNGLVVLVFLWPLMLLWRGFKTGWDRVAMALCAFLTLSMLNTQRLTGTYALVAAPYLARDLNAWIRGRRWPAWTRPVWVRAGLAVAACFGVSLWEWDRVEMPLGIKLDWARYPVKACDWIAQHGVRGRGYNDSYLGGYIAWRFWPEKDRLPFSTGTPEALTKEDRTLVPLAAVNQASWERLDAKYRFDYVVLNRRIETGASPLLDFLDADSTRWSLVFADDAAALYLRRDGPLESLANRYEYHWVSGGVDAMAARFDRAIDPLMRFSLRDELLRNLAESPYNARAHDALSRLAWNESRLKDARWHITQALLASPLTPVLHERLGLMYLAAGKPDSALTEFKKERRNRIDGRGIELRMGQAYQALGNRGAAIHHYRNELRLVPDDAAARESLTVLRAW